MRVRLLAGFVVLALTRAAVGETPPDDATAASDSRSAAAVATPVLHSWVVGGVKREALAAVPEKAPEGGFPVVFVFHGHGGTMRNSARKFALHELWPEAIVVYMQGLPTPGRFDPNGTRPGWQKLDADQENRDLRFVDAVVADLKGRHEVNEKRMYVTGHSNGGGFTYVLWRNRPDVFAAFAPSAAGGGRNLVGLKPRPVLCIAGKADEVVRFETQERSIEAVQKINSCAAESQPWKAGAKIYDSPGGTPVVTYIHEGGHSFPDDARKVIVEFFKSLPGATAPEENQTPP
jgi:polyhydroxybutyrate depolymerase